MNKNFSNRDESVLVIHNEIIHNSFDMRFKGMYKIDYDLLSILDVPKCVLIMIQKVFLYASDFFK